MIRSLADLLSALRSKEAEKLTEFGFVGHPGMIGDMYEGLTREMLNRSLFDSLDLRVVTGKARAEDGTLSRQVDAMLVVGDGDALPHTEHFIYPVRQVLAAVEVKKTLYGDALGEAYDNLASLSGQPFLGAAPSERVTRAFTRLTRQTLPTNDNLDSLPPELFLFASALISESSLPVRIVFGYDGYKSEKSLRSGFLDYLERVAADGPAVGYGPESLPSLIVCGVNSLVKLNAMPYSAVHARDDWWLLYGSMAGNPCLPFLELIWTRLASEFDLHADIFGEDLELEAVKALLLAQPRQVGERWGWFYEAEEMDSRTLQRLSVWTEWSPLSLTTHEAAILSLLCRSGEIDIANDAVWKSFRAEADDGGRALLERLRLAGIAAVNDGRVSLLTTDLQIICLPDLGFVAAENETGRLTRWILRRQGAAVAGS